MPGKRIFNDLARSLSIIARKYLSVGRLTIKKIYTTYYYSWLEFYKPIFMAGILQANNTLYGLLHCSLGWG